MFTTLTTLAAVAALHSQTVADATSAPLTRVSAPDVTAVSAIAKPTTPRVRIPGTFAVGPDSDVLDGVHALYVVRSGDGA